MTGSQISRVAYPLLVFSLGGSASEAGLVAAAALLPYVLVGIPAGVIVDRWNRKALMIACDAGRLAALGCIPLAGALGHLSMAQLAATVAVDSGLYILFNAAQVAALPRIVGREQLTSALARDQAGLQSALLAGPSLGGYLFQALGRTAPFLCDALSYGVSAVSLLFLRTELQQRPSERRTPVLQDMGEGLSWLWRHPLVRFLTLTTGALFFVSNGSYLIVLVLARHLGATPTGVGIVLAAGSLGGLLGSSISVYAARALRFSTVVAGSVWIQALLLPLYIVAPTPLMLALVTAAITLVEAAADPIRYGYQLSLIPDGLQGRVNSAASSLVFIPMWLGSAAAGIALDRLGRVGTVWAAAGLLLVLALLLSLSREVRRVTVDSR